MPLLVGRDDGVRAVSAFARSGSQLRMSSVGANDGEIGPASTHSDARARAATLSSRPAGRAAKGYRSGRAAGRTVTLRISCSVHPRPSDKACGRRETPQQAPKSVSASRVQCRQQ